MQLIGQGREAEVFSLDDDSTKCIKLFYPGRLQFLIDEEIFNMQFVQSCGITSPKVYQIQTIDNRLGIVMERLQGKSLFRSAMSGQLEPAKIGSIMGKLQKDYHKIKAPQLKSMKDTLIWQIKQENGLTNVQKSSILKYLDSLKEGDSLVHMDFHCDNVINTKDGPKIIDWIGARRGNPYADAARTLMTFEEGSYPVDASPELCKQIDQVCGILREEYINSYIDSENQLKEIIAWKPIIAAARLYCCPNEEKLVNEKIITEFLG